MPAQKKAPGFRKFELKLLHRKHISNFAKALHLMGVNVKEHALALGVTEEELTKLESEISAESFISNQDKASLKKAIETFIAVGEGFVRIESSLYKEVQPLVHYAYAITTPVTSLKLIPYLKYFGKRVHHWVAMRTQTRVPRVRNILFGSFQSEKNGVFERYPKLLNALEKACAEIVKLEKKWGNKGSDFRAAFFRIHNDLRKIMHDDIYVISDEIFRTYNLRLEIYRWLIKADKILEPRLVPSLEKEYEKVRAIKQRYLNLYTKHAINLNKIYTRGRK